MSIRSLRTLKAVIDHHSFANAARMLNMTPSAVSMQISGLEKMLGATLFDRRHRPPRLTRAGETVAQYARGIVEQYDTMVERLADARAHRDSFRLAAVPTVLANIVTTTLLALRRQHPNLVVNVTSNLSGALVNLVDIGEVDGALMHKPNVIDSRFDWREICRQRLVVIAPRDSTETDLEKLFARHAYIRFNRSAWVAPLIEERLARLGIAPDTNAEIESADAIHQMVELGFGISVLPDMRVHGMAYERYRVLDFGDPPIFRHIGLLSRKSSHKKRTRDIVCAMLEEVAKPYADPDPRMLVTGGEARKVDQGRQENEPSGRVMSARDNTIAPE